MNKKPYTCLTIMFYTFHTKGFSYANNTVKTYSKQYLSSSEPLTNMAQCLGMISQSGVQLCHKVMFINYGWANLSDQFLLLTFSFR